jgi:CDP-diacylglycerol--serine O-phosphatidyltransferase
VLVGGLMVSRLPTFSFKKGRIPRHLVLPSLLVAALTMGVIASSPWIGLSLLGLIYRRLIPFSWLAYRRQEPEREKRGRRRGALALGRRLEH